jgi:hypothetical protein
MDIAFHYFAVKTLARRASFSELDVQQIATFSQYIDDYNPYIRHYYSNIPQSLKDSVKYDLYNGSYASNHLADAIGRYRAATTDTDKSRGLMYIGMTLHTFADTYAHQLFSGLSEWANNTDILSVTNNITGADETQLYKDRQVQFLYWLKKLAPSITPMIGHMHVAHVPDYTHISFSKSYPIDPKSHVADGVYTRSNTEEFAKASQKIRLYLIWLKLARRFPGISLHI